MVESFLLGAIFMWLFIWVGAMVIDSMNDYDTDYAQVWFDAWDVAPELRAVITLIKGVK